MFNEPKMKKNKKNYFNFPQETLNKMIEISKERKDRLLTLKLAEINSFVDNFKKK